MPDDGSHQEQRGEHARKEVAAAWAVHAFTASGIVLGFLALLAILDGDKIAVFIWLGLALFVDGIDGALARRAKVSEVTPDFDGATLDNVIDYFNYTAVPAMMIYWFNFVPDGYATAAAAAVMAVSLYTFANLGMKSHDYYFVGFPALWNLVVLYFHVLQTGPWTNLTVIVICCILTFVPWKYVHPFRVKDWRSWTVPITVLWAATSLRLVLIDPGEAKFREASPVIFWLWVGASVYFGWLSIWRSLQPEPEEDDEVDVD